MDVRPLPQPQSLPLVQSVPKLRAYMVVPSACLLQFGVCVRQARRREASRFLKQLCPGLNCAAPPALIRGRDTKPALLQAPEVRQTLAHRGNGGSVIQKTPEAL